MALIKRGRIYWLDIRIKGKRVRRSLHATKKPEALDRFGKKKEELLAEYGLKKVKFSSFCEKYLEWAWSSKPASTLREEQRLEKIKEFFERKQIVYLSEITPYHIEQLKIELKARKLAKSTINRYLQLLRGLFYRAIDWDIYKGQNPLKKIRFYRENCQIRPLSPSQINEILRVAKEISENPKSELQAKFYDLCLFALNTGMRKSEILNLKWKDIREHEAII